MVVEDSHQVIVVAVVDTVVGVVAMAAVEVEVEVVDQPGLVSHDTLNSEVCVIFAVGKV